ncbi:MAG: tRNA (adenosine(37)-N6)-threonylcarbamoyltransferase complex dimerization subunit type 1 TsaB [SAR202 cluster bacterium]|nr:tRNA (adenosine(37)-N6)-threonylcarbamoyltransferase complex dimerization subunit type 1 TsaB [SAR202 cluster bacterium]|tara:strand:+ start:59554 stop:60219 length:666 start_codon:yes stop_codon:yes gene_type:complete
MELSIDTSTRQASIGLSEGGNILAKTSWKSKQNHSKECFPKIINLLEEANSKSSDIDSVFVSKGPGGFSALRVGISIAKSFATAAKIPLIGVCSLDIEAYEFLNNNKTVWAVISAGFNKIYVKKYTDNLENPCELISTEKFFSYLVGKEIICGEGVLENLNNFKSEIPNSTIIPKMTNPTRKPEILSKIGINKILSKKIDNPETLEPIYIGGSQHASAKKK